MAAMNSNFDYRLQLKAELEARKLKNSSYSIRAFARDLGISVTALHGVLNAERHLSRKNLALISEELQWSKAHLDWAMESTNGKSSSKNEILSDDRFRMISDWFYLPILSFIKVSKAKSTSAGISKSLGLEKGIVLTALERLTRLGLIQKINGQYQRLSPNFGTQVDVPSQAVRNYHKQVLAEAANKLDSVPVERREYLAITIPVSSAHLEKFKQHIRSFRDEFINEANTQSADEVYQLNIQLFPWTEKAND